MKANKICSIALIIFAALWAFCILIFNDLDNAGFYFWGGFVFGLIALLLGACVNLFIIPRDNRNTTEIEMIPIYVTTVFVVAMVIFNAVFVYLKDGKYNIAIPVVNVIAIVAYLIYIHGLSSYADRVVRTAELVGSKTSRYGAITTEISKILGMCNDTDIKKKVLDLKQKVDYSNNLSQNVSMDEEEDFYNTLRSLESMILDGSSKEDIVSLLEEADNIWKIRNSKLSNMA